MLKYTTILHKERKILQLSVIEYTIADMIYHLSSNPKAPTPGWCTKCRDNMAEDIGFSKRGLQGAISRLIQKNIIERNEKGHVRTTSFWYEIVIEKKGGEQTSWGVNKLHGGGEQTSPLGVNKLHPIYIEDNNRINSDVVDNKKEEKSFPNPVEESFPPERLNPRNTIQAEEAAAVDPCQPLLSYGARKLLEAKRNASGTLTPIHPSIHTSATEIVQHRANMGAKTQDPFFDKETGQSLKPLAVQKKLAERVWIYIGDEARVEYFKQAGIHPSWWNEKGQNPKIAKYFTRWAGAYIEYYMRTPDNHIGRWEPNVIDHLRLTPDSKIAMSFINIYLKPKNIKRQSPELLKKTEQNATKKYNPATGTK